MYKTTDTDCLPIWQIPIPNIGQSLILLLSTHKFEPPLLTECIINLFQVMRLERNFTPRAKIQLLHFGILERYY